MDLRITEIFLSVQGESCHAGRPCAFVRLTGCPMRCTWCDSEYTFTGGDRMSFASIFERLDAFGCKLLEVTGGEPLAQKNAFPFIAELCDRGYEVLIETGGFVSTAEVDRRAKLILDVKCPASGESERNHWPNLARLDATRDEVKFVVADLADLDFAFRTIDEYNHTLTAPYSMAIASYPANGDTRESFLRAADMAMYAAKNAGRDDIRSFDEIEALVK